MNRKALLSVVAVFTLGVLLGGLGVYVWVKPVSAQGTSKRAGNGHLHRLKEALVLSPDQQEQVRAILTDTKGQFDATYETIRPQMDAIRQQGRRNIRAVLSQEQLPKFEEYLRQLDEERKRKGR